MPRRDAAPDALFIDFQSAVAGRYSLDRELGRGGSGVVYLAREVHLDRLIAIKLLPPERAAEGTLRERFVREARLAAKLSHPNIIPIHAVDDVDGFVFFVMSFVDGETLAQRVRARGPLSASEGTRVLREVAWALAYAHAQGFVHRDVKPDNILLERGSGRALVADFGIAAAIDAVDADGVAGTPEFMSPEQALGQAVDARSDLYSLGATAFYAFSGRLVFEGGSATEVLAKHVTEAPPTVASLGAGVPRRLGAMIDRCLAKDPSHRPRDAAMFAEQMAGALVQRREVPAALRDFVKRTGRIDGAGAIISATAISIGSVIMSGFYGGMVGFGTLVLGATLTPAAYLVSAARKLVRSGFTHQDLEPAFRGELDSASEERTAVHGAELSLVERLARQITRVSFPVAGVLLGGILASDLFPFGYVLARELLPMFAIFGSTWVVAGTVYVLQLQRREDVDTRVWSRVWLGRLGRGLFGIAKRVTQPPAFGSAMTHRATELSIGVAAEQLFDRLPRETREALAELPAVLQRLQDDARSIRMRHDELADALAGAGEAGDTEVYADLRALRDEARAKLTLAVGALETLRLNLLRLHAGSESVEGLTTQLGLASEVSAEVERIIAAREEVERALLFPRAIAHTPA